VECRSGKAGCGRRFRKSCVYIFTYSITCSIHIYMIYVYIQIYIYIMWTYSVDQSEKFGINVAPKKRAAVDIFEIHAYTYLHIQILSCI